MQPSPELYPMERIELALKELGSAGYLWSTRVPESSSDQGEIKVTAGERDYDPNSPPGTGAVRHFTIDAYALNTTIIFELLRPWEAANIKPIRKITVTVE